MRSCLKVRLQAKKSVSKIKTFMMQAAQKTSIEGVGQVSKDKIQLLVCGHEQNVDAFIDALYADQLTFDFCEIEVEPCVDERSFRGVFRIVE